MIGYRCKCGEAYGSSSMGFNDCQGCKKCNTTFASHPDGHKTLKEHDWDTMYNERTGKPYKMCKDCMHRDEESYKLSQVTEEA